MGVFLISLAISAFITYIKEEMREDFYCRFFYTFLVIFLIKSLTF